MLDPRRQKHLATLIARLGLPETAPVDYRLLDRALIHSSLSPTENYERLELLGDAVVRLLASEVLLADAPNASVGEVAAIRAALVSDRVLAEFGHSFGLDRYLLLSPAAANQRHSWRSRLADAFEAVLGALYLSDPAMTALRPWLAPFLRAKAEEIRRDPSYRNYKDALQAWTQGEWNALPDYRVREVGAAKRPEFEAEVWLHQTLLGRGRGYSKKEAEQAAARAALANADLSPRRPRADANPVP